MSEHSPQNVAGQEDASDDELDTFVNALFDAAPGVVPRSPPVALVSVIGSGSDQSVELVTATASLSWFIALPLKEATSGLSMFRQRTVIGGPNLGRDPQKSVAATWITACLRNVCVSRSRARTGSR